jgi:hypothetical protein
MERRVQNGYGARSLALLALIGAGSTLGCKSPPPTATRVAPAPKPGQKVATASPTKGAAELPTARAEGATIVLSGRNHPVAFAKSGKFWGVAWRRETGRRTRLHIGDTCYEEVYFTFFDDQLRPQLDAPLRVMKRRKCVPFSERKVEIVSTPKGFAISPSNIGARFDLTSKRLVKGSVFPTPAVAPALKDPPKQDVVYERPIWTRSLGGSAVLRTWVGYNNPRPTAPVELRYVVSPDGKRIARRGTVIKVAQKDAYWFKTFLVRTGKTVSLFMVLRNRISRQRFGADGGLVGKLELLVEEGDAAADKTKYSQDGKSIYNVTVTTLGGQCVILYTRGNTGMKVYSCKTNKRRYLGEATSPSLFCAGARCVMSEAGTRIRFLSL